MAWILCSDGDEVSLLRKQRINVYKEFGAGSMVSTPCRIEREGIENEFADHQWYALETCHIHCCVQAAEAKRYFSFNVIEETDEELYAKRIKRLTDNRRSVSGTLGENGDN